VTFIHLIRRVVFNECGLGRHIEKRVPQPHFLFISDDNAVGNITVEVL
jgi:hypothetical protein